MYYCGFTYKETYNIPVAYKRWFIERLNKEITKSQETNNQIPSRAMHHNPADARALMGMSRQESPARLRRFT